MIDLDEFKSRINPAYQNTKGTESHERKTLCDEIESLRQQLEMAEACLAGDNALIVGLKNDIAEKDAEIERLKTVPMKYRRMAFNAQLQYENNELEKQLAACQAREQRLREALHYSLGAWHYDGVSDEHGSIFQEANNRCDQPADTTALSAMIQKAGEVMWDRCMKEAMNNTGNWAMTFRLIRALPGVTLEDLKK